MTPTRVYRLLARLCAVGMALALSAAPASAAFPGVNGKIAFDHRRGIYTVWANGDGLRRAVRNGGDPARSPDGTKIAFERQDANYTFHIWVKDMVTGVRTQITSSLRDDRFPAWSPDGTKIAFSSFRHDGTGAWDGLWYIAATRPFGSRQLVLASKPGDSAYDLAWSPDGTKIAFAYHPYWDGTEIGVMPVGSPGTPLTILTSEGDAGDPTWSPNGKQIAYSSGWLSVMNADGSNQRHFYASQSSIFSLAWSPDGRKIAAGIDWEYSSMIITLNPRTGAWIDQEIAWELWNLDWGRMPS